MELIIAISVFVSAAALMMAILTRPAGTIQRRLQMFRAMAVVDDDSERDPTFSERVLRPVVTAFMRTFRVVMPASVLHKLQWRLTVAGDPLSITGLLVMWGLCAAALPGGLFVLLSSTGGLTSQAMLLLVAFIVLGAYLPHLWLKNTMERRQKHILKTMPDAIDLLTTCVEAGLGIDAALAQVAEKVGGPLARELKRVLREMAMGNARRDALKAMAERTQVGDVQTFVNALIQAEAMGVSLAQVIRVQADQMRMRRRQRAEEQAHKAPVKITIPLVLFFFPTILIVILGPAGLRLSEIFGSGE